MRLRGERDAKLSHPAFRLLSRLISERVNSRDGADDEFPLPWSKAAKWLGLAKDQSYSYLAELGARHYLKSEGLRGCPAQNFYRFVFRREDGLEAANSSWRENPATGCRKNPPTSGRENPATSSRKNPPRHISKSFRQGRVIGSLRSPGGLGKDSTSLRSQRAGTGKTVHDATPAVAGSKLSPGLESALEAFSAVKKELHP